MMPGTGVLMQYWCPRLVVMVAPASGGGEAAATTTPDVGESRRSGASVGLAKEYIGRLVMNAGVPGVVGVLLLVAAALGGYAANTDIDRRAAALAEEQSRTERNASAPAPGSDDRARVAAFVGRFPPAAALPDSLRRLNEHGAAHGISVRRTDYGSSVVAGTPLTLVSLTIPVEADAAALYVWLGALLREMPEIALESLSFKRDKSDAETVEADIRLQLYLRGRS
ncbi:hypothetical protein U5817_18570 [Aromatoleum evansii]|uniref:Transmembrane protein n=1 Tax=Aromatoleum evansii TaxID=59406 RepID=A0ABZ1AH44_AROEV|nr:hypothetical protein U5817_18570 [Aromatoleum evansii]